MENWGIALAATTDDPSADMSRSGIIFGFVNAM
jgi:hypothetical protein